MKEDLNDTCKVLTNPTIINACRKDHAFFMSLLRRRSMMKIKSPKLLLKTMRVTKERCNDKDFDDDEDEDDDEHRNKKKNKKVFTDKVGSIFNNIFRFKKCRQSASSSSSNSSGNGFRVHDNDQGQCSLVSSLQDDLSESSRQIDTSSIKAMSPESKDDEGKKSIAAALEQVLKVKDDHQSFPRGLFDDLSNSFGRRNSFNFIKGNMNRRTISRRRRVENKTGNETKNDGEANSGGGRGRDDELCKKRILMGEKCRPLNLSGTLHYDKDGIILPEL